MEAILQNVPQWNPQPSTVKTEWQNSKNDEASRLTFKQFDLKVVLEKGARLIGSEGSEFDCHEETTAGGGDSNGNSEKEVLIRQRMLLNEKLGLTQSMQSILNMSELVTLEDMQNNSKQYEPNKSLIPVQEVLNMESTNCGSNGSSAASSAASLSCREMNRAKRKARQYQSQTSSSGNAGSASNQSINMPSVSMNSATHSRSNSLSNGSFSDDQPETKKLKLTEDCVSSANGKSLGLLGKCEHSFNHFSICFRCGTRWDWCLA